MNNIDDHPLRRPQRRRPEPVVRQHPPQHARRRRPPAWIRDDDLRGVTSNPAIFEKAIVGTDEYDDAIRQAPRRLPWLPARELFLLALDDIRSRR